MVSSRRQNAISLLAEGIAQKGIVNGIVCPRRVADQYGINYTFHKFDDDSFLGTLRYDSNLKAPFHIFINETAFCGKSIEDGRVRSTFAHELGHFFISEHRKQLKSGVQLLKYGAENDNIHDLYELEANIFAANLLMPRTLYVTAAKSMEPGIIGAIRLASHFNTSITSSIFHYAKCDIMPCISIYWSANGVFRSRWISRPFQQISKRSVLLKFNASRPIMEHEIVPVGNSGMTIERGMSNLSSWIYAFPKTNENVLLVEETCDLGVHGRITMLYPADLFRK